MISALMSLIVLSFPFLVKAADVTVEGLTMQKEQIINYKSTLTKETIELNGPSMKKDFYFTLDKAITTGTNEVVFYIRYSDLLKSPSTMSVALNDITLKSVDLTSEKIKEVKVSLPTEALTQGTHKITVGYSGVLKEGVCVAPGELGNWLTVEIPSYLTLNNAQDQVIDFTQYPTAFIPNDNVHTTIVLANEASLTEKNKALQLAAYLAKQSTKMPVIVEESEVEGFDGPIIVIGKREQFESTLINAMLKANQEGITLGKVNGQLPLMTIIAHKETIIEKLVDALLQPMLYEQLQGTQLPSSSIPTIKTTSNHHITLKDLGMSDLMLQTGNEKSITYFYTFPPNTNAQLHMTLRKSEVLPKDTEQGERKTELITYINQVPIGTDLRELKPNDAGDYDVTIPIPREILSKRAITSMQFEVTGFTLSDPCEITNERYWIQIDENSTIDWQTIDNKEAVVTLQSYPSQFFEKTTIVVPNKITGANLNQLLPIYKSLIVNGEVAQTTLVQDKDLTEKDKSQSMIIVGEAKDFPKTDANHRLEEMEKKRKAFFIQEGLGNSIYLQSNPWNAETAIALITLSQNSDMFFTKIFDITEPTNAAMQLSNESLLTAPTEITPNKKETTTSLSLITLVPFIVMAFVIVLLVIYVLARRKKSKPVEK